MTLFPKGYQGRRDRGPKSWAGPNRGSQCRCGNCDGKGWTSSRKSKPSSKSGSGNVGDACRTCKGTGWVKR